MVQGPIGIAHRQGDVAMGRGDAADLNERPANALAEGKYIGPLAADHAFIGAIDDQDMGFLPRPNMAHSRIGRHADHADYPIDRSLGRPTPLGASRVIGRREIADEQCGYAQPAKHLVAIAPDAQAKQAGRLTQAVTDCRVGLDAERPQQVGD